MIIMALDHVREFFHADFLRFQPDDLTRTTPILFFTRWITHFCAPAFFLTAGIGAFLWLRNGRTLPQLSRFLCTRGLWLVFLELTVFRLAMNFSLLQGMVLLSILWALGWSMVALALLVRLPVRILAPLSIAVITLHNLADRIPPSVFGKQLWIWNILHQPGLFQVGSVPVLAAYPLIPWIFVMSAGFCLGRVFLWEPVRRTRFLFSTGLVVNMAFVLIRWVNIYGDPRPWSHTPPGMTLLSFLRCNKYPPSLDFLLMTLGPAILLLAALDHVTLPKTNPLLIFGRVPLFYFLGHFFVIHFAAVLFALVRYGDASFLFGPMASLGGKFPADYGYGLGVVYSVWIAVVFFMYGLCLWFARVKQHRQAWWLGYL